MALLALLAGIVAILALALYGPVLIWRGFNTWPKLTGLALALFVIALLFAALTFHHFFPQCVFFLRIVRC